VRALDHVSVELAAGEIHGIVGENGAGKSTLVEIIGGAIRADRGTIELGGEPLVFSGPSDARARGIAVVHQEFHSLLHLSATENVLLGSRTTSGVIVNWPKAHKEAEAVFGELGVEVDVHSPMRSLKPAQRKFTEIANALYGAASVILLDEPTAALDPDDSDRLLRVMRLLAERGLAVAFVSHRLEEVIRVTDQVTVLRDGRKVGTWPTREASVTTLIRHMVGRELEEIKPQTKDSNAAIALDVDGAALRGILDDVSLQVRAGEIVGICGLLGSGRSELARAIFGALPLDRGNVSVFGRQLRPGSTSHAMAAGVAFVPPNRKEDGLISTMDVQSNISLAVLRRLKRHLLVDRKRERSLSRAFVKRLRVAATGIDQPVETLSGGNQQKVLIARWLATEPRVLIVDEPTQGVDVGAKFEIHQLINELADAGMGVLLISSDLPELLTMSDRVLVMRSGRVSGEFCRGEATQESVIAAASGHCLS